METRLDNLEKRVEKMEKWIVDWEMACDLYEKGMLMEPELNDLYRDKTRDN